MPKCNYVVFAGYNRCKIAHVLNSEAPGLTLCGWNVCSRDAYSTRKPKELRICGNCLRVINKK